jgi:hypothetical protein
MGKIAVRAGEAEFDPHFIREYVLQTLKYSWDMPFPLLHCPWRD